jgi:phage gpG-like protein
MSEAIRIEVDDAEVKAWIVRLVHAAADLSPVLRQIGDQQTAATQLRFREGKGPDGQAWAPLSQRTMLGRLMRAKRNFRRNGVGVRRKDGSLVRRGLASLSAQGRRVAAAGFRPLLDTGTLRNSITRVLEGRGAVIVGTNWGAGSIENGAAIHQLGGRAGRGKSVRIPARPFLGVSDNDRSEILDILRDYFTGAAKP